MRAPKLVGAAVLVCLVGGALTEAGCGGGKGNRSTTTPRAPYAVLVNAGTYLLRHGNVSAAEQLFSQAIAREPNAPLAHYDLGVAYQQAGDRRDALHEYRFVLRADPGNTSALFNEATLIASVNAPLAIFYYRRILAMKPDSPTALLNLGLLEAASHWPRRAVVASLHRAVVLDPALRSSIPAAYRRAVLRK